MVYHNGSMYQSSHDVKKYYSLLFFLYYKVSGEYNEFEGEDWFLTIHL